VSTASDHYYFSPYDYSISSTHGVRDSHKQRFTEANTVSNTRENLFSSPSPKSNAFHPLRIEIYNNTCNYPVHPFLAIPEVPAKHATQRTQITGVLQFPLPIIQSSSPSGLDPQNLLSGFAFVLPSSKHAKVTRICHS
jgi:hypothetical protein